MSLSPPAIISIIVSTDHRIVLFSLSFSLTKIQTHKMPVNKNNLLRPKFSIMRHSGLLPAAPVIQIPPALFRRRGRTAAEHVFSQINEVADIYGSVTVDITATRVRCRAA